MTDIVGTDSVQGQNVSWYYATDANVTATYTVTSTDVTNTYVTIPDSGKAEYGLIVITYDDGSGAAEIAITEYSTGTTPATEATGTTTFTYTGMAADDELVIKYVDIATTDLVQVAACKDVTTSMSADTKAEAIHGQANKVKSVGAVDQTATLEELEYNEDFIGLVLGTKLSDTPASNLHKWTSAFTGMKKIGALLGVESNTAGTVVKKYALVGAQASSAEYNFAREEFYTKSFSFDCDYMIIADFVA